MGFGLEFLFPVAKILLIMFTVVFVVDLLLMYKTKTPIKVDRVLPELLSITDKNEISLQITNNYPFAINVEIVDELPYQLQEREFEIEGEIEANKTSKVTYDIFPDERGEYNFGVVNVFTMSFIGLVKRRVKGSQAMKAKVYPSVNQMKKFE